MIDIRTILLRGHAAMREAKAAKEAALRGHPRVGSAGCVAADGEVYGTCPRIALLRGLGVEERPKLHTEIMWGGGLANEWWWGQVLEAGMSCDMMRLDTPELKQHISRVPKELLGHPDVMLACTDETPMFGLELKGVFGNTQAVGATLGVPKNDNLIQAAAYSHFLGKLPWALCYTSYCYTSLKPWQKGEVPLEYRDQFNNILPFYRVFYLEWRDDELWYRDEMSTEWVRTVITGAGIEDYYRLVQEMGEARDLGPRPSSHYVDGTPNKWGRESMCGLCPFRSACDQYDASKDYGEWLEGVKRITAITSNSEVAA